MRKSDGERRGESRGWRRERGGESVTRDRTGLPLDTWQWLAIFMKLGLKKPRTKPAGMTMVVRPRILRAAAWTSL